MKINKIQKYFIECACDLQNHIIDFEMSNKEFKEMTGIIKSQMRTAIKGLRNKLKNDK